MNTQLMVMIPVELAQRIVTMAAAQSCTKSELVRSALTAHLATLEGLPPTEPIIRSETACDRAVRTLRPKIEAHDGPMLQHLIVDSMARLGFTRRTVSMALLRLAEDGLIEMQESARGPVAIPGPRHPLAENNSSAPADNA